MSIVYWNLGTAYKALREHRRAIEFYERALGILREFGDRESETAAAWELGTIYEQEGDLSRAMALLQARVDYEREVGSPEVEEHQLFVEKLRSQGGSG